VRAKRSTLRAAARGKDYSRMLGTKTSWKTLEEQIAIWK
jgi:hypothetical protein